MSHLDQVVDLRAAGNARFPDAGAVNAGVGLNFNVIFNDRRPGLYDLVPVAVVVFSEAEPVAAYYDSVLQHNVVADAAELAHDRVRMSHEIGSDPDSAVDDHVRQ